MKLTIIVASDPEGYNVNREITLPDDADSFQVAYALEDVADDIYHDGKDAR